MEDNNQIFSRLYIKSLEENYNSEKMIFLMNNNEKTEKDFIENKIEDIHLSELEFLKKCNLTDSEIYDECKKNERYIDGIKGEYDKKALALYIEHLVKDFKEKFNKEKIKNGPSKILMFYQTKLNNLPNTLISTDNIDLSNSNAVQKIIYLNELGIIDLLRSEPCFFSSVNNLTNIITAITGEKHTTIQPYLNVLINKTGNENNDPYKTKNTVNKVKNELINLGVKPK
jgi:hypothetical protein